MHLQFPSSSSIWVGLLVVTLVAGCQSPEDSRVELTESQQQQAQSHLLAETPDLDHRLEVEFDESVELVGVDVDGRVAPGQDVEMTWYWRALEEIDEDWKIFVHFDSEQERFRQNLDHYPLEDQMNQRYRFYHLEQNELVADRQAFTVREDYPAGDAVFYVGLFQEDDGDRAQVTNDGPATDDHRAIGPDFEIEGE